MKVILMHGKDASPKDKWYPWFKRELKDKGVNVQIPVLPNSSDPILQEWLDEIGNLSPDQATVLVGHSRGGVAILRYLERLEPEIRIKKVILIAVNSGFIKNRFIKKESNNGFYTKEGYDFTKIKSHCDEFVVYHSQDDPWVPFSHGGENARGLGAKFITFEDKRHFGKSDGEVPGLIDVILKTSYFFY